MEWLKSGITPLRDLIAFLNKKAQTNNIHKKRLIKELRNNLNVFSNGFLNNSSYDIIIDLLGNEAFQDAIEHNFTFKKLKAGKIEQHHIHDERNRRYISWDAERLADKIDEKITELRNIKKLNNDSVKDVKNNVALMMSNLYFRMKLLADFIMAG